MQDTQDVRVKRILDEVLASAPGATEVLEGRALNNGCKPSIDAREYHPDKEALEFHLTGQGGRGQIFYLKVSKEEANVARKALASLNSRMREYFSD